MKKIVYLIAFLLPLCITASAQQQPPQGPPTGPKTPFMKKGATIPPFKIDKTAGGVITNANLKKGKPVMIMIFSPQCDHCEYIVDSLKTVADKFKTTQLLLVAEDRNKQYMKDFIKKTDIGNHPLFLQTGTNKGELIFSIYTYKVLPQINFYDAQHKLVKTFDGNYPFDSVKMFIQ